MEETKEQKKARMLAMRKLVKDTAKGKSLPDNAKYLAQLALSPEDNTRLVIALQDALDKEIRKRRQAEKHIMMSKAAIKNARTELGSLSVAIHQISQNQNALREQVLTMRKANQELMVKDSAKDREITALRTLMGLPQKPNQSHDTASMVPEEQG